MTRKEYYELLVRSAYDGTFPSVYKGKGVVTCYYRKDRTAECKQRCAIGLLIPDESYRASIDPSSVDEVMHLVEMPEGMTVKDLEEIQEAHDDTSLDSLEWQPKEFVQRINDLDCFNDLVPQGV